MRAGDIHVDTLVALLIICDYNGHMTDDTKHRRRKLAWEQLPTPRVSWEEFKRINDRSSSLEQAVVRAERIIRKKHN